MFRAMNPPFSAAIPAAMLAAALVALVGVDDAAATSGFGCYRVNVGNDDPLVVRTEPSASAAAIAEVTSEDQPIIALAGLPRGEDFQPSLFDVHQAEMSACQPSSLPLGARWCPVMLVDADGTKSGWLKRRFVDHNECP